MTGTFQSVTQHAVLLPKRQRYLLANLLLEMNEVQIDSKNEIDRCWDEELLKRAKNIRSGKVKSKSVSEVLKKLR